MEGWTRRRRLSDGNEADSGLYGEGRRQESRGSVTKLRLREAARAVNLDDVERGRGWLVDRNCQNLRRRIFENMRKSHEETMPHD